MMLLPEKQEGKYIKVAVLVADEPDCRNQIYTPREIKQIYTTEANSTTHDIYHNKSKISGVTVIGNYWNKYSETVASVEVPGGSWYKILHVTNEAVLVGIDEGLINGVSTTLKADKESKYCTCNQNLPIGEILYSDVENKECFLTTYLSFVEEGCNNIPLEVYDSYESYLDNKNVNLMKVDIMDKEEKENGFLENIRKGFSEGFKLGKESAVNNTAPPSLEPVKEPVSTDEQSTPTLEQISNLLKDEVPNLVKESLVNNSAEFLKASESDESKEDIIRNLIIDKYYSDEDYPDMWIIETYDDCVVIRDYSEPAYYKVDYSGEGENISISDRVEVELIYSEKGANIDTSNSDDGSEVNNSIEERIKALEEKVSEVNNSNKKPLPSIREELKDVASSESVVNNENNNENKTDSYGRPAQSYKSK